jgi:hypothetical protein
MSFPKSIARYKPTQDILDLGRPDRVFCGSSRIAAVIKYILVFIGMACIASTMGTVIGFFVFAPPAIHSNDGALGLLVFGAALLLIVGGLVVASAYWLLRPSCYLIYPDGMAFTQGKGWIMLAWEDVKAFRPSRDDPHLLMKDGSKIEIHESAPYVGDLHELILDRLVETCASHGIAFGTADELPDPLHAEPLSNEEPRSPVGMAFGGTLLVIAAAWFYLEDAGGAISKDWLDVIGGKAVAAGLILVAGLGLIITGFFELAKGQRVRKSGKLRWEARYRPNN